MRPTRLVVFALLIVTAISGGRAETAGAPSSREVENLAALAHVYGYVRYFCPSDEAGTVDWDKVGVIAAEAVRHAPDSAALRDALQHLFGPIAPGMVIRTETDNAATARPANPQVAAPVTFWQYQGLSLSPSQVYRSRRVVPDTVKGNQQPLFTPAEPPPVIRERLPAGLLFEMPSALPLGPSRHAPAASASEVAALRTQLDALNKAGFTEEDWRVRVAGVITVWTAFQHFHPYLKGDAWAATLRPALEHALRRVTADDYYTTLMELVAHSGDGHGYVSTPREGIGGLAWRVTLAEGQLVVTAAAKETSLQRGDVVESIDGTPALDVLHAVERITSGSPQLRQFRALNQIGEGPVERGAHVVVRRGNEQVVVDLARDRMRRGYFFKDGLSEFELPRIRELQPGLWYVNLLTIAPAELEEHLPQLADARGVILDWRWDGRMPADRNSKQIKIDTDVISHLIDKKIQASPLLVPQVTRPNRVGWSYRESTWPVMPNAPRFKGKIVVITDPATVSYGETCMAMIADYKLATQVGAPTAGTNGNASFIPLPGGYRVMWTAMDVLKHDRTPFYGVGFVPDVPVARTLRGIAEGRDEYLDAAIATLTAQVAAR